MKERMREKERAIDRQMETDRDREREREKDRQRQRQRERERKPRKVNITDFKKINNKHSETSLYVNLVRYFRTNSGCRKGNSRVCYYEIKIN